MKYSHRGWPQRVCKHPRELLLCVRGLFAVLFDRGILLLPVCCTLPLGLGNLLIHCAVLGRQSVKH